MKDLPGGSGTFQPFKWCFPLALHIFYSMFYCSTKAWRLPSGSSCILVDQLLQARYFVKTFFKHNHYRYNFLFFSVLTLSFHMALAYVLWCPQFRYLQHIQIRGSIICSKCNWYMSLHSAQMLSLLRWHSVNKIKILFCLHLLI